ncbi:MAG: hypothetical protein HRT45_14120 [Bdellovibrionales bacterium]|nr:hypothetical protein [Bdellovibrionales bacterium]
METEQQPKKQADLRPTVEGEDYVWENGYMVLTAHFLKKRGYCCESGCRNCPYAADSKENLRD